MRAIAIATLAVVLLSWTAQAWWCTGHMTIAEIAKRNLDDGVYDQVNSIIQSLSASGPFPKAPDFIQSACWADDLKESNLAEMAGWHFINQPYDPSNYPIARWPIQKENVETLIMQLDDSVKYETIKWNLNFALANLIHFYGDIHQPLHATELFSATYPTGDRGGNMENVTVDGTQTKLHFIWDAVCWEYNKELDRPLSSASLEVVTKFATYLTNTYSFTDAQKSEYNSTKMALESFNDAVSTAYPGTYDGMTIDAAYLAKCKPVAEARVAIAGYRLASQLNYMFGSGSGSSSSSSGSFRADDDEGNIALTKRIRDHIVRGHVEMQNLKHTHLAQFQQRVKDAKKH